MALSIVAGEASDQALSRLAAAALAAAALAAAVCVITRDRVNPQKARVGNGHVGGTCVTKAWASDTCERRGRWGRRPRLCVFGWQHRHQALQNSRVPCTAKVACSRTNTMSASLGQPFPIQVYDV